MSTVLDIDEARHTGDVGIEVVSYPRVESALLQSFAKRLAEDISAVSLT